MLKTNHNAPVITERTLESPFVVVGGGLSGISAAIAAARHGIKVILIQDRPMLGGNASSEIRMGITGAQKDFCKETGILEELQMMNYYYNPLLRYTLWDDIFYSAVVRESNITLLLNTSVQSVKTDGNSIESVTAWNGNEYCSYTIRGTLFADCSGDSILRLSGADYVTGREGRDIYGESYAPETSDSFTMGNSLLMQLREIKEHREFHKPEWAYSFNDETIPKNRRLDIPENNFWWLEYGGTCDTVADAGTIQKELKKITYGVWDYLKNHPDGRARNWELDWIGSLPGKRESARYVGDYVLTQQDVLSGGDFPDAVGHGGWPLDDHSPEAFFNHDTPSQSFETPSPYGIPFRSLYSRNIDNLFFAGRNISASHMGISSTRVMGTCSVLGQAVGTAAAMAFLNHCPPREIYEKHIGELRNELMEDDQFIPNGKREISPLTLKAVVTHEVLRNGMDRPWDDQDNGAWFAPGESASYTFETPVEIHSCRIIFDTNLEFKGKRQHKHEGIDTFVKMPPMLAKAFRLEALSGGKYVTVYEDSSNFLRMRRVSFDPVETTVFRLVVLETWGAEKAHIFSFEVS